MSPSKKTGRPAKKDTTQPTSGFLSNIRWGESYVSLLLGAVVVILAAALGLFYVKLHQPQEQILPPAQISRALTVTTSASTSAQTTPTVTQTPSSKIVSPTKSITPTATTAKQNGQKTYVVQKNDDLWNIAIKEYGSGYSWVSIAQANHLANPSKIYSGNTLLIPSVTPILVQNNANQQITPTPSKSELTPTHSTRSGSTTIKPTSSLKPSISSKSKNPSVSPTQTNNAITGSTYTVMKGDTLWSIAVRAYGNGYKWVDIAKANHLTNPSVIHSGNVLTIPRKQTL